MYWILLGLGGAAAGFLGDFIRGRQYGVEWYDWSFIANWRAMLTGGTVAAVIVAANVGERWQNLLLAAIPAVLIGAIAALTVDRFQRRRRGRRPEQS